MTGAVHQIFNFFLLNYLFFKPISYKLWGHFNVLVLEILFEFYLALLI
jgi:hypothetical protein